MSERIIVIGGGVVGLATALELARRGARVDVLDRQTPGREASWAGAGILSLLLPGDYGDAVNSLAEASTRLYPGWIDWLRGLGRTDPEYRPTGMLVLPPCDPGATRGPDGHRRPLPSGIGIPSGSLWLPEVAQVRNPKLLQTLIEAAAALDVTIHADTPVTGLDCLDGRVAAVVTADGRRKADTVVVAAGAWSADLLGPLAHGLPIRPMRGQMLLYQSEPDRLACIVYERGRYLVPRRDGLILAGSTIEDVGFDQSTTPEAGADLHAFAARLLPELADRPPIRHWAGLRPGSPDNRPIIARHPELANLYVNSGHFRYGVTLAPASARLLADLLENVDTGHLSSRSPGRPKNDLAPSGGGSDRRAEPGAHLSRLYDWPDTMRAGPV